MRIVLMTALMALAVAAWADESGAPAERSAPVEQAAAKTEAPADAAAAEKPAEQATAAVAEPADDKERVFKPPQGYRPKRINGDQVYCTKVVVLGSRFPKEDCRTEAQLRDIENQKKSMRSEMEQKNKVCAGGGACQSF
jgi:hypothetical protein